VCSPSSGGGLSASPNGDGTCGNAPTVGCSIKWLDKATLHDSEAQAISKEPVPLEKVDVAGIKALRQNTTGKTLLVNDPRGLRELNEHLAVLRFPYLTPPTIVTRSAARLRAFQAERGLPDGPGVIAAYVAERFPQVPPPATVDDGLALLREREPEPEAPLGPGAALVHAVEALEDLLLVLGRDAWPFVGHHQRRTPSLFFGDDPNLRTRGAVLDRVVDEV